MSCNGLAGLLEAFLGQADTALHYSVFVSARRQEKQP